MTVDVAMSRDRFREAVFARDGGRCVSCGEVAVDAHHILERRLWPDGGYHLDNGASVCAGCHLAAERTDLSCDRLRELAGIRRVLLPPHLYRDQAYDKWGNPIQPNGTRLRGELFDDPSVRKVLGGVLHLFVDAVKYPRTYHLPDSPGATDDDRVLSDLSSLLGREVVVTLKMDGENTTLYRDRLHARSVSYESHPSRDRVRALHASLAHDIPEGWRVCGENLTAVHSIRYEDLPGHLLVFGVWDSRNVCLSWDETETWAALLGLPLVPLLWRGTFSDGTSALVRGLLRERPGEHEGFVVRLAGEFHYSEFRRSVAKWVRRDHVRTHGHWMRSRLEFNGVR